MFTITYFEEFFNNRSVGLSILGAVPDTPDTIVERTMSTMFVPYIFLDLSIPDDTIQIFLECRYHNPSP